MRGLGAFLRCNWLFMMKPISYKQRIKHSKPWSPSQELIILEDIGEGLRGHQSIFLNNQSITDKNIDRYLKPSKPLTTPIPLPPPTYPFLKWFLLTGIQFA